jgi:S1-C subfamily serine protease
MFGNKLLPLLWITGWLSTVVLGVAMATQNCAGKISCQDHSKAQSIESIDRHPLNSEELKTLAKKITVQIQAGSISGSGVIFDRITSPKGNQQGDRYRVVTNAHNLIQQSSVQLRTIDGHLHQAVRSNVNNLGNNDLAILEFHSTSSYQVAEWSRQPAKKGSLIIFAGFAYDKNEVTMSDAEVSHFLEKPLKRGYQLGYTNSVRQGMSGGPIIDRTGLLIGVNAISAYPLLNRIYVFADGTKPPANLIKQMRRSNWGVPVMPYLANLN